MQEISGSSLWHVLLLVGTGRDGAASAQEVVAREGGELLSCRALFLRLASEQDPLTTVVVGKNCAFPVVFH